MSNRTLEAPEAIEFDVDRSIGTHTGRDDVDSRHRQQSEQHGGQQSGFHGVGFTEWFEERGEKRGGAGPNGTRHVTDDTSVLKTGWGIARRSESERAGFY